MDQYPEEVTSALDFFRRHGVLPAEAHEMLDRAQKPPFVLVGHRESMQISPETRERILELLDSHTMHGAL